MKTLVKLVMLLTILFVYTPAQGDILIFKKTIKCQGADLVAGASDDLYKSKLKGFVIFDVTYTGGRITDVSDAFQINYGIDAGGKWTDYLYHDFDIQRYNVNGTIAYGLVQDGDDISDLYALILIGIAKLQNIGNASPNEVPQRLSGNAIQHIEGDFSESCTYNLRLNKKMTTQANQGNMTFEQAYDFVKAYLQNKGYTGLPADLP